MHFKFVRRDPKGVEKTFSCNVGSRKRFNEMLNQWNSKGTFVYFEAVQSKLNSALKRTYTGAPDDVIIKALVAIGWTQEDATQAVANKL